MCRNQSNHYSMNHSDFENVFPDLFPFPAPQELDAALTAPSKSFRRDLRECLLALPYRSFLVVVAQLLERQGSQNVRFAGREGFVGRNQGGGWDLEAVLPPFQSFACGQPGVRSLVQVKQFKNLSVQQRSVDELRGCCLRAGAGQGLLVTLSRFSSVAVQAAKASALAPIVLVDGEDLLNLLIQHGMGVVRLVSGTLELDPEFFQLLDAKAAASLKQKANKEKANKEKAKASASANFQRRTSKPAQPLIVSTVPRAPLGGKPHRSETAVLHFSVTVDARAGNTRRKTKVQKENRSD